METRHINNRTKEEEKYKTNLITLKVDRLYFVKSAINVRSRNEKAEQNKIGFVKYLH